MLDVSGDGSGHSFADSLPRGIYDQSITAESTQSNYGHTKQFQNPQTP